MEEDGGTWRVSDWEGELGDRPTPTPVAGGGGGSGGGLPPEPDRAEILSILLANANCIRADAGLPPVEYDAELAAVLQPFADYATRYAEERHWLGGLPPNDAEIEAAIAPYGAFLIDEGGIPLSFVPGNAQDGLFAYNWEDYDGDPYPPCAAGWSRWYPEQWTSRPMTRVAIVLGPTVWFGPDYHTVMIIAGR